LAADERQLKTERLAGESAAEEEELLAADERG
jgi:hypothetical protein